MQELSLLEEKAVKGGLLMMRHPVHSKHEGEETYQYVGSGSSRKGGKHSEEFISGRQAVVDEINEEPKKVKASTGEWVTVRTGSGIDFKD